jgi:hypothetical protein
VIQHKVLAKKNYAYIEFRGQPSLAGFISAMRLFVNDPDYSADLHRICDFSQADVSHITIGSLTHFAEYAKAKIPMHRHTKCAIVATEANRSGIFEAFVDHMETGNFRVFYNPAEAVKWIKEVPAKPAFFDKILSGVA